MYTYMYKQVTWGMQESNSVLIKGVSSFQRVKSHAIDRTQVSRN